MIDAARNNDEEDSKTESGTLVESKEQKTRKLDKGAGERRRRRKRSTRSDHFRTFTSKIP